MRDPETKRLASSGFSSNWATQTPTKPNLDRFLDYRGFDMCVLLSDLGEHPYASIAPHSPTPLESILALPMTSSPIAHASNLLIENGYH